MAGVDDETESAGEAEMKTAIIALLFVFHGAHARTVFYPEGGPNGGWRQEVTGVPEWLAKRLKYDHVWEVQMGAKDAWLWEPVRDGDVIEMDERGVVRITQSPAASGPDLPQSKTAASAKE